MQNFVYIETYGCSANKNNSEIMSGLLKQGGYELTNNQNIAEIIIINTCIVKTKTESKIKRRIQDLSKLYKNKLMIIAGCMPETDRHSLKTINPNLLLLGIHHIKEICQLISDYKNNQINNHQKEKEYFSVKNEEKLCIPKISSNKLISIIQISEGCLGECKFCKTKLAKGPLFSYDENKILKSIESDLKTGAKEIWLTSQDCASYGLDREDKKPKLPELLRKILALNHRFKIRLGMMNPNHLYPILDEMTDIYKNPKIYKFIHIPIQSASNKILKDMNRYYNLERAEIIIKKFKEQFPDATIATDIIAGYPDETEQDHQINMDFIQKFKPDVLNLSKFSTHPGTEAGKLKPLPLYTVNKRTSQLMELHRKISKNSKLKYKDKEIKVFINTKTKIPNILEARDDNYNIVLIKSNDKSISGKTIKVKIKQTGVHHMIGEIL
ncbi:tRNA (N(6)-L-threonylcarbamoyladenosine(37)-C(2))-methylthiotransferase [Candidatus Pacearchaeota archaeon]|nr:tRNA (N(6)-L-threonylcarbamoyladenosine(37)-C(2))-methylthiotransferase [Candidatus Pacearchaeota archaeon]